jgi:uncharacterized protein
MENILIDAGPIIALFNKRDSYHTKALNFLKNNKNPLWTTWPVITEACHLLDFNPRAQINLLEWIKRGGIEIFPLANPHLNRIITLSETYSDVPMDLADASLMVVAEEKEINSIATIDSGFYIYRDIRNRYLTNIFV